MGNGPGAPKSRPGRGIRSSCQKKNYWERRATSLLPQGLACFLCTTDQRVSSGLTILELFQAPNGASKRWLAHAKGAREEAVRTWRAEHLHLQVLGAWRGLCRTYTSLDLSLDLQDPDSDTSGLAISNTLAKGLSTTRWTRPTPRVPAGWERSGGHLEPVQLVVQGRLQPQQRLLLLAQLLKPAKHGVPSRPPSAWRPVATS